MRLLCLILLLAACSTEPFGAAPQYLSTPTDAGPTGEVWPIGRTILGETDNGDQWPTRLFRWEPTSTENVLRIGNGQPGFMYGAVDALRLDASDKVSFMLGGTQVMKLQDHPTLQTPLLHLSRVPSLYFGNENFRDVDLTFQGFSPPGYFDPDYHGYQMTIRGQSVSAGSSSTAVHGGDVVVAAGDANASRAEVATDPGELILRGGRTGAQTRGSIALGDPPDTWAAAEGVVYVDDAPVQPNGPAAGGGFLYAQGGALYWMGSAGTVTQLAAP